MKLNNRKALMALALLSLTAGACVCGTLGRQARQTAEDVRNTAGTAQAAATDVAEAIGTGQAVATDVGSVLATGQAIATAAFDVGRELATGVAPLGSTIEAGLAELGPTLIAADLDEVRQWGVSATATSQRESINYSAAQTVSVPNTPVCGDSPAAWASLDPHGQGEELTVLYAEPVIPTEIIIYESFNPGFVTQVRVVDVFGNTPIVYQSAPALVDGCPRPFSIPISTIIDPIRAVIITVDQATAPSGTQIDAVQLVGFH